MSQKSRQPHEPPACMTSYPVPCGMSNPQCSSQRRLLWSSFFKQGPHSATTPSLTLPFASLPQPGFHPRFRVDPTGPDRSTPTPPGSPLPCPFHRGDRSESPAVSARRTSDDPGPGRRVGSRRRASVPFASTGRSPG